MKITLVTTHQMVPKPEADVSVARFFIGRAEDCQLRLRSHLISRYHCVILAEDGLVSIRDLGGKNGTFLNGRRIAGEVELRSGDLLRIGPVAFEVRIAEEPSDAGEEPSAPAPTSQIEASATKTIPPQASQATLPGEPSADYGAPREGRTEIEVCRLP